MALMPPASALQYRLKLKNITEIQTAIYLKHPCCAAPCFLTPIATIKCLYTHITKENNKRNHSRALLKVTELSQNSCFGKRQIFLQFVCWLFTSFPVSPFHLLSASSFSFLWLSVQPVSSSWLALAWLAPGAGSVPAGRAGRARPSAWWVGKCSSRR